MITRRINIIVFRNKFSEEKTERLNSSQSKNFAMITRKKKDFNFHGGQFSRSVQSESSERKCNIKDFELYQN